MRLDSLTRPSLIFPLLEVSDRAQLLKVLADQLVEKKVARDSKKLFEKFLEREELGSTGIGSGIAIPHCKFEGLGSVVLAIASTTEPIDFQAVDEKPVQLFFCVVSPVNDPAAHLRCLASISKAVAGGKLVGDIISQHDPAAIFSLLSDNEAP